MDVGHPIFWLWVAAVAAPLLAEVPLGFKVPVVVLEVVLGIVIGPHVLGLAHFEGFVVTMFKLAMASTLFMAGMELDFGAIRGRPIVLAMGGWGISVLLGLGAVGVLHVVPDVHAPLVVTLALCTTGLGILMPIFRDGGQLDTAFGRLLMAAGTLGEFGPIIAMSLLLSKEYTTWQELGFLVVFIAIVGTAIAVGMGARPPRVLALLRRHMQSSTQLPVRIALLMMGALFLLAQKFGFESIFGAFAAGMIVGQATRGEEGKPMREKIDAVSFGWFYPFFFVGTGIKFDIAALGHSLTTLLMVPTFFALLLIVRGLPVVLYRKDVDRPQRLSFALFCAVPSLSLIVVITEIGMAAGAMKKDIATGLVGAALLAALVFPTVGGALLHRRAARAAPTNAKPEDATAHAK